MQSIAKGTRQALLVALLAASTTMAEERKPSVGFRIGQLIRQTDRRVQDELDRRPRARQHITTGIDRFADNLIDAVTPEADAQTRRVQRNAVQLMLNPSRAESDRAMHDMIDAVSGATRGGSSRVGSAHHRPAPRSHSASHGNGPSVSARPVRATGPAPVSSHTIHRPPSQSGSGTARRRQNDSGTAPNPPADWPVLHADWHGRLWQDADAGLIAAVQDLQGLLPKLHGRLAGWMRQLGLSSNASATVASAIMFLAAMLVLHVLLVRPRTKLWRRTRQLRKQQATRSLAT